MKKKNLKPIVLSSLAAMAMAGIVTGGTLALFTDKAETEIKIGAGIVDVHTTIELVEYSSSVDGTVADLSGTAAYTNNNVGSNFSLNGQTVVIDKMVPGDALTVKVKNINRSNVVTKTRFVVSHAEVDEKKDLFPALDLSFTPNDGDLANLVKWKTAPASIDSAGNIIDTVIDEVLIKIEFTNHGTEITSRDEGEDNAYQGAACAIGFGAQAVQGNAAVNVIDEINSYLAIEKIIEGKNDTMHDAMVDVKELGYGFDEIEGYVYGADLDEFVAESTVSESKNRYFKVFDEMPATSDFSIYASDTFSDYDVVLNGIGFDAGDALRIDNVNYHGVSASPRYNYIRSNSFNTNIVVEAPEDSVSHYGDAASVTINGVASHSYHEFGTVPFLEVAQGRVALEQGSSVERMHFQYNDTENKFEEIIVSYDKNTVLPEFSRDVVENIHPNGTLVVELQNSLDEHQALSEYIWLYQQGLIQQIRVSDNGDSAGNQKATDNSVSAQAKKAAQEIANELKGGSTATAEEIEAGTINAADIVEKGLTAAEKAEASEEIIEKKQEASVVDKTVRIGGVGYDSLSSAIKAAKDGDVLVLLDDVAESNAIHGKKLTVDLNGHSVSPSGKNYAFCVYDSDKVTIKNGTLNGYIRIGEHQRTIVRWILENDRVSTRASYGYHPLAPVKDLVLDNVTVNSNDKQALLFTNVEDDLTRDGGDQLYGRYIYKKGYESYKEYTAHNLNEICTPLEGTDHVTVKGGTYNADAIAGNTVEGILDIESGTFSNASAARYAGEKVVVGETAEKFVIPSATPAEYKGRVNNAYFNYEGGADDAIEFANIGETVYLRESATATKELGKDDTLNVVLEAQGIEWTGAVAKTGYELLKETDSQDASLIHYATDVIKAAAIVRGDTVINYGTLQEAFDNCQNNDTIKLLADVTIEKEAGTYNGTKFGIMYSNRFTFDLNGHTLTYHGEGAAILLSTKSGPTIFKDSSSAKTGQIIADNAKGYCIGKKNGNSETLKIESGTYIAENNIPIYIEQVNSFTINGGKFVGKEYWLAKGTMKTSSFSDNATYLPSKDATKPTGCFAKGTLITLANGEKKPIEELKPGDEVATWNFFTGEKSINGLTIIVNHGESEYHVNDLSFDDGSTISLIADHGLFDYDRNEFIYPDAENYSEFVGDRFYKEDGSLAKLVGLETKVITTGAYSITSANDFNVFADGMLSVAPPQEFYNWIPMGESMHYDVEAFEKDLATYGEYTYEDFAEYVTEEQFNAWNGRYLKVAVEKGYFTFNYILELIGMYSDSFVA